jgi:hypothetical protein
MNDFLNPKSMMTPGMAGALVMFLSNAVCFQFPEIAPRWMALLLSFVLGALVVAAVELKPFPRVGFCLVNSLIIFAVAAGSAGFAAKASNPGAGSTAAVLEFLVPSAYAQNATAASAVDHADDMASLKVQLAAAQARIAQQQVQLQDLQRTSATGAAPPAPKSPAKPKNNVNRFFKEW